MAGEPANLPTRKTLSWFLEGRSAEDKEGVDGADAYGKAQRHGAV